MIYYWTMSSPMRPYCQQPRERTVVAVGRRGQAAVMGGNRRKTWAKAGYERGRQYSTEYRKVFLKDE